MAVTTSPLLCSVHVLGYRFPSGAASHLTQPLQVVNPTVAIQPISSLGHKEFFDLGKDRNC